MRYNVKMFEVSAARPTARPTALKPMTVDASDSDRALRAARDLLLRRYKIRSLNISTNPRELIAYVHRR